MMHVLYVSHHLHVAATSHIPSAQTFNHQPDTMPPITSILLLLLLSGLGGGNGGPTVLGSWDNKFTATAVEDIEALWLRSPWGAG